MGLLGRDDAGIAEATMLHVSEIAITYALHAKYLSSIGNVAPCLLPSYVKDAIKGDTMRCRFCGLQLEQREDACPRCHGDLTRDTRLREMRISLVYFVVCVIVVSLIILAVLR